MAGLELFKQIKELSPQTTVIIIARTHNPAAKQRAHLYEARAFLDKGRPLSELLSNFEKIIETLVKKSDITQGVLNENPCCRR